MRPKRFESIKAKPERNADSAAREAFLECGGLLVLSPPKGRRGFPKAGEIRQQSAGRLPALPEGSCDDARIPQHRSWCYHRRRFGGHFQP